MLDISDARSFSARVQPGAVFAQRFTIVRAAGSGGMGSVFAATDRANGQQVALKVLHDREAHGERFEREARVLAALRHPGIVGYVAHGATADGEQWLAMEWLEGTSLSDRLKAGGFTVDDTIEVGHQIAAALAVAHQAGVVHRDIKPSNLFLVGGRTAVVKILDFGIARVRGGGATGPRGPTLTGTGAVIGSPGYMAPEQARGLKDLDARADVFSLGCVLFRCLTGKTAFTADDPIAALLKLALEEAPRPSELCDGIPEALDRLVARMMAKSPADRPSNASIVRDELHAMASAPLPAAVRGAPRARTEVGGASVVLVRGAFHETDRAEDLEPMQRQLRFEADKYGAELDILADGSMFIVVRGTEAATQLAARAARAALAVRAVLDRPVSMGIVTATELRAGTPEGDALARAAALLGATQDIRLDETTADLLEGRFPLGRQATGPAVLLGDDAAPFGAPARSLPPTRSRATAGRVRAARAARARGSGGSPPPPSPAASPDESEGV